MPTFESAAKKSVPPPLPEKRKFSALVKSKEATPEVTGIRADEQFITKTEAYHGVAAKLKAINEELDDLRALQASGAESAATKKRQAELLAEAKKLIGYMDTMEKGVTEEQARASLTEQAEIMVENPFYTEEPIALSEKDLEEVPEIDEADVEKEGEEKPVRTMEKRLDKKGLQARYAELKKKNEQYNTDIKKTERAEKIVMGLISEIQGAGPAWREAQAKTGIDALAALTGEDKSVVAAVEQASRSTINYLKLNKILETIDDRITRLAQEKGRVLVEMSDVRDHIKRAESDEVGRSLRAGKADQDIERSLKAGQKKGKKPPTPDTFREAA